LRLLQRAGYCDTIEAQAAGHLGKGSRAVSGSNDAARHDRVPDSIDATDQQIDRLVYELYGLTAEEIRIVEGANQG
jgi:hypothetical protein